MVKFIDEIVNYYQEHLLDNALKTCIITPNKRAHRFIKNKLIGKLEKGDFLPEIFAIDDFILKLTPWLKIDEVDLTYELYEVFQSQSQEDFDFDEFINYASILLHDFNEIDMQMANGTSIFSYLNDAKAIQQWNPDGSPLSASQKEYLRFYNQLADIYSLFRDKLINKGICYQGMAYRYFAENLDAFIKSIPYKNMLFAGFNALTKSEETIIKKLYQYKIAHTLWDADKYYVNNKIMESGLYLRKYRTWNKEIELQSATHFQKSHKQIMIYGSPGVLGQARITANIVESETEKNTPNNLEIFEDNTAIVPADESLLIPLLNSLPTHILEKTNITMGFPIQHSHCYRLTESLIRMHIHSSKISRPEQSIIRFHKDNILEICNNELIKNIHPQTKIDTSLFKQVFIGQMAVSTVLNEHGLNIIADAFISCQDKPSVLINQLQLVLKVLLKQHRQENTYILGEQEKNAIEQILQVLKRLYILVEKHQKPDNLTSFFLLYKKLSQSLSQSFQGNINKGIQLMGLLETRLMDFKNVILLSVNEDILPSSAFTNSFIPSDIKYEFEMPGIQERTAVYAYHFYRLIQRAENVYIIYSTTKKKLSGGEKSRFIKQLEFELKKYAPKINISHQLLNFKKADAQKTQDITIPKSDKILVKLHQLAEYGISPTAISSYIRCPLQFYFKYIAKLKEPDQTEDIIDERIIGNVIHHILENFYRPFVGKKFPINELFHLQKKLPDLITKEFSNEFDGNIEEGANYLSLKDTEYYLKQFVQYEINHSDKKSDLTILGVEEKLQRKMTIKIEGEPKDILIRGNADRIDMKNGQMRILDYKTGNVKKEKIKISKPSDHEILHPIFCKPEFDKALQLYIYQWLYQPNTPLKIEAGIISFRLLKSPYIMLADHLNKPDKLNQDFQILISEIFDPTLSFAQTEDLQNCKYCPYINICSKKPDEH